MVDLSEPRLQLHSISCRKAVTRLDLDNLLMGDPGLRGLIYFTAVLKVPDLRTSDIPKKFGELKELLY